MKRVWIVLLIGVLALGLAVGCGGPEPAAEPDAAEPGEADVEESAENGEEEARVEDDGVLVMGTNADFPPFEFRNEQNEVDGFDVDIANAIAEALGRDLVIEDMSFDGLIPALQAKRIDMVVAGMTITEERSERVNFSDPYYNAGQTIVVREDNEDIQSVEDLQDKKVAVQLGTTGDFEAHDRLPDENITQFNQVNEAFLELGNNRVDAIIIDIPVAERYIQLRDGFKTVGGAFTEEFFGIAVHKENPELLEEVNQVLAELKDSGVYDELISKWFE